MPLSPEDIGKISIKDYTVDESLYSSLGEENAHLAVLVDQSVAKRALVSIPQFGGVTYIPRSDDIENVEDAWENPEIREAVKESYKQAGWDARIYSVNPKNIVTNYLSLREPVQNNLALLIDNNFYFSNKFDQEWQEFIVKDKIQAILVPKEQLKRIGYIQLDYYPEDIPDNVEQDILVELGKMYVAGKEHEELESDMPLELATSVLSYLEHKKITSRISKPNRPERKQIKNLLSGFKQHSEEEIINELHRLGNDNYLNGKTLIVHDKTDRLYRESGTLMLDLYELISE